MRKRMHSLVDRYQACEIVVYILELENQLRIKMLATQFADSKLDFSKFLDFTPGTRRVGVWPTH